MTRKKRLPLYDRFTGKFNPWFEPEYDLEVPGTNPGAPGRPVDTQPPEVNAGTSDLRKTEDDTDRTCPPANQG